MQAHPLNFNNTGLRVVLVGAGAGQPLLHNHIRTLHGTDLALIAHDAGLDFDRLPPSCLVTFSGLPDARLLTDLSHHGFKIVMLLRHPIDALITLAQMQPGLAGVSPTSAAFRDFALGETVRAALGSSVQWSCIEACLVIRHEALARSPVETLGHLCRHLGCDDRPVTTRIAPLLELDAPGLWADVVPAKTLKPACELHREFFALLDHPLPSQDPPSAEACEQAWDALLENHRLEADPVKMLQRQLLASEDRRHQDVRELQILQADSLSQFEHITAKNTEIAFHKNEAARLRRLLYGSSAKNHLFRAWRVVRGDAHYRQYDRTAQIAPATAAPAPAVNPATISGYHDLFIGDLHLRFHKSALCDVRGSGRVAQELLQQFRALADSSPACVKKTTRPPVHFFAVPHWGPENLPDRSCVLIHDVIPLIDHAYPQHQRIIFETRCRSVIRQAAKIISISQTSARDIALHLGMNASDITVIQNGVSSLPVSETPTITLPAAPYLVYIGGGDSHKNLEVVIKAMRRPAVGRIHLVLIGENERYRSIIESFRLEKRTHILGRLHDPDMAYVVKHAAALVFPSYYEGFGLPPLEAARLGIPSICSRRPAMTELLADAALFADPDSPDEWAQRIGALVAYPALARTVAQLAQAKVAHLQWQTAAQDYLKIFQSL